MYAAGEDERSAVAADNNIAISFWGKVHESQRALRKIKRKERQRERERDSQLYHRPFSASVSRRRGYEKVNTPVGTGGRAEEEEEEETG